MCIRDRLYVAALNAYRRILLHAKEKGIPVTVLKAGQVLKFGIDTKMRILAPKSCVVDAYMEIVERAYSLEADTDCLLYTSGQRSVLRASDSVWQFFIFCIPKSCPARINYMAGRWPALVRLAMDHLCNNKGYWISAAEPDDGKG